MRRRWIGLALVLAALLLLGLLRVSVPAVEGTMDLPPPSPVQPLEPDGPLLAEAEVHTGPFDVACPMVTWGPPTPEHVAVLVFTEVDGTETKWVPGTSDEAWLRFSAPTHEGAGLITLRGYEQASVVWWTTDDGELECHFPDIPKLTSKTRIRAAIPELLEHEVVSMRVCRENEWDRQSCRIHSAYAMDDELDFTHDSGTWSIELCRRWGDLHGCTEPEDLTIGEDEQILELDWPPRPAGTGVAIRRTEEGLLVIGVAPDGPGDRAGIVPGEVIDKVQGEVRFIQPRGFQEIVIGEEGETVTLRIEDEDGERHVPVTLEKITGAL